MKIINRIYLFFSLKERRAELVRQNKQNKTNEADQEVKSDESALNVKIETASSG